MSNLPAQTNLRQAGDSCQHSQYQPGARKTYKPAVLDARLFYDPADGHGQRWEQRCIRKRDLWQALFYISHGKLTTRATEAEFAKLMHCNRRTARRGMRDFLAQGFAKNIRKHGYRGDMERELLPDRLGRYEAPPSKHVRTRVRTSTPTGVRVNSFGEVHSEKSDTADTAKTAVGPVAPFETTTTKENAPSNGTDRPRAMDTPASESEPSTFCEGGAPTRETNTRHTPQSAFDTAVRIFTWSTWFKIYEPYAIGLAFWIASRALRASGKHPLVVAYYVKSAENFFEQYSEAQQIALMLDGRDRYQAEIDRLHGRSARKRPHRHLSVAQQRDARNKEVIKRVSARYRQELNEQLRVIADKITREKAQPRVTAAKTGTCAHSEEETTAQLERGHFKPETIEEYEARLAEYAAVHPDNLVALKFIRAELGYLPAGVHEEGGVP